MNKIIPLAAAEMTPLLNRNHYEYMNFVPSYSTVEDAGRNVTNPFTSIRTSYLPLANPTFSVEWLGESDRIAKGLGIPRNTTENWNTYCRRVLDDNIEIYEKLKTECEEVFGVEFEIKNSIETFMSKLTSENTLNADTITQFKGLHEILIPHIQKLRTLQPLLVGLGIDTTKVFTELGTATDVIDSKIKEKGNATNVTSATDLFSLYVVKSCVGELTKDDKQAIKIFWPLLKLGENTINLFLRSSNSAENFVAIHSIETFVQQKIDEQTILNVHSNFLKLGTVDSFEKLIQMYVTIESYGSNEQKELVREGHLDFKKTITRTIDKNLEIQNLMAKDPSLEDQIIPDYVTYSSIQEHAKGLFFITVKDCNDFFGSYILFTSSAPSSYQNDLAKKKRTCTYILSPDNYKMPSNSILVPEILELFYQTPSVELLIRSVKEKFNFLGLNIFKPNSSPNWPTYWETVYSRGVYLTIFFGEMKWTACNHIMETIKSGQMVSCTINEFKQNQQIATNMMSSFNEILLNLEYDDRFPTLASNLLSSIDIYIIKLKEFKTQNPEITDELKTDFEDIEYFAQSAISFKYEHIQPNKLGMNIIINIIQTSKEIIPSGYSDTFTIKQMEDFITTSYRNKKIPLYLYNQISNLISVTKIHQAIWEMKIKRTPLDEPSANNLNIQGLYKLTTIDLKENVAVGTLLKLREGQTSIALSNEFFSKNKIVPTNSKVYDSLLTGSMTNSTKEQVSKDYIGFLRTSSSGLIIQRNFPLVVEAQSTFDQAFYKTNLEIVKTIPNDLEWSKRVSMYFKLFNLYWDAKNENLVEIRKTQTSTVQLYERDVLYHYNNELTRVNSIDKLIKLKSKIFQITTNGMLPIMNNITELLHSKYGELSPNEYSTNFNIAHEMVTSKFLDYPDSSDNKIIFTVISFHLAIQGTELFNTFETYIKKTKDSPLQIANGLFIISRNPLVSVPVLYEPIVTRETYELQIKKNITTTHFLDSFYHLTQLFEFGLTLSHEPRFENIQSFLKHNLERFLKHNLNKDKLTIYTEILRNPYVYTNPSIKDFCVTVITGYLFPEKFPEKREYNAQFYEDVATIQLGGNSSTHTLISWVTETNSKAFSETPLDVWPEQEPRKAGMFALPYDMSEADEFLKPSYNASGVKNERFSDEPQPPQPPQPPPPPDDWISIMYNSSETSVNNSKIAIFNKQINEKILPVTPEKVSNGSELAVSFDKQMYKTFFQELFGYYKFDLSNIQVLKTVDFLWKLNPNEDFVIAAMPHIAYVPNFEKLFYDIQQSMINKIKKSLLKWMETMAMDIDNVDSDRRSQMINLLLTRELLVGELGNNIIDLTLGCLFSVYKYERGLGRIIVDVPSFAVEMRDVLEKYEHKSYDANMLYVYIKQSFLMITDIPNYVWDSDTFFKAVFDSVNIDKFFKSRRKETEGSASSIIFITDTTGLSIADQTVRSTLGRAQTEADMRLGTLDYNLNTECLNPIKVFTLDFLLSRNSSDLILVEEHHKKILQTCESIKSEKLQVIRRMPAPPSKLFDINPELKLSRAKIDFVKGTQNLRSEIETLRPISSIKIKGMINSTMDELQFLSSDPSYVLIHSNLITFQSTFGSLLDRFDVAQKDVVNETFIGSYDFLVNKASTLQTKYDLVNKTVVQYRKVNEEMNEELARFTGELKINGITLSYSELEQKALTIMGQLQERGQLKNYQITLENAEEIRKQIQIIKIKDYTLVDCSGQILAIQTKLNDANYLILPEKREEFQSQIYLMEGPQTELKNSRAFLTLQSKINTLIPMFTYDDPMKEKYKPSLKDLRITNTRIYTLFEDFDGEKVGIVDYEVKTKKKMQETISLYESSIESLETELENQKSVANSTLQDVNVVILMDEPHYTKIDLPSLKVTKTKFDSDVERIKTQKTFLNDLLGNIQQLTGEETVRDTGVSFDDSGFEGRSELLGTVILERERELVSEKQKETETAYTQVESFLTEVVANIMTIVPSTANTKEINYNDIYQDFNTSYVSFEITATRELDSYNEMTYIKKNSSEISTRHQLKRETLMFSLQSVKDAIPKFNQNVINFKTMTSLYDNATQIVSEFNAATNKVNELGLNLKNTGAIYSQLTSIRRDLFKIPNIVLEQTFTNDILDVEQIRTDLTRYKEGLISQVQRVQSEIQNSTTVEETRSKTAEYLTILDNLFAVTGDDQYDDTHLISGMAQSATSYLADEEGRFESQANADKHILEQQEEIVGFLSDVQNSVRTNNVTESALNQFTPHMDKYQVFLSSDEKGEEWSSNVFNPINDSVSRQMSLLSTERSSTVKLFNELQAFKAVSINPILGNKIVDLVAAKGVYDEGILKLELCGNSTKNSRLILTKETLQKETGELESAATALEGLSLLIGNKIRTDEAVGVIKETSNNIMFLERNLTLVVINSAIENVTRAISYDPTNPEFIQFETAIANLRVEYNTIIEEINRVRQNVTAINGTLMQKQLEFDSAQERGKLDSMQRIFGEMDAAKSTYDAELSVFVKLTETTTYDDNQDTYSMKRILNQQVTDNEAAIKTLSDNVHNDDIIATRVANTNETTTAETAVFDYFRNVDSLIDSRQIRDEDIRLFQNKTTLNSLLERVKLAQDNETLYITSNKLTTENDSDAMRLANSQSTYLIFNTTQTQTQQMVDEKLKVLIQTDQERSVQIKNFKEFVQTNIEPLLVGQIQNLTAAITKSEMAKSLLDLIPPPVISRDTSLEQFNASTYSQMFVKVNSTILDKAAKNVKTELEIKRQEAITTSFSHAKVVTKNVSIPTLNIPESTSLLGTISFTLQQLESLNVSNMDLQYVGLKQFETDLKSRITSLNGTKTQLVNESTTMYSEIGAFQTTFNSSKSDITRKQISDTTVKYIATLNKITQISGENTYRTRIEELLLQLETNKLDYLNFVQSETITAAKKTTASDEKVKGYFELVGNLVDTKNITRTQLNEYEYESDSLYKKLGESVKSEISTIKLNGISGDSSVLTQPPTTLLETRKTQKETLDLKIAGLKERDSVRTGKIKSLKQTSNSFDVMIPGYMTDDETTSFYVSYQTFLKDFNSIAPPEVIDDSELTIYMSTTVKAFMEHCEYTIENSKKSITNLLLEEKPESFSKSGLSILINTSQVFGEKFTILGQVTTDEEKSKQPYLTIASTETKLLEEIEDKRGKLEIKVTEANDGYNKTNAESGKFIEDYDEPKDSFQLEEMKSISTNLTSSIRLTVSNFQEINTLNGTDTNNDKIVLLETRNTKIQEIVLREETRAFLVLKFRIGTSHNLTTSRQSEFSAYVLYWSNGIKNKNITTDDDPMLVSGQYKQKKQLVLDAFDSEIEEDSKNAEALRGSKLIFLNQTIEQERNLESEIYQFETKESERVEQHLLYKKFIVTDVKPLILIPKLFEVESATLVYEKGLAMFQSLKKSEIIGKEDNTTANELSELKLVIYLREASIKAVVESTDKAKGVLLTATANIPKRGIVSVLWYSIKQPEVTQTRFMIEESKKLLRLYETEIIKLEGLYEKGAEIKSIIAFRKVYIQESLDISEHETINNKHQEDINSSIANKEREFSSLQKSIITQSANLITDGNVKFEVETETLKQTTYKKDVDAFRKLVVAKYSDQAAIENIMTYYDKIYTDTSTAVNFRTQSLQSLRTKTSTQYESTKIEIDGLLPTKKSWLILTQIDEFAFNDAYFSGINIKVASARSSLESLQTTVANEIAEQSPNSKRISELQSLFQTLDTNLTTKSETIDAARVKFASEKLAKEEEMKRTVLAEVNQNITRFGEDTNNYDSIISEIGIDKSSTLINTLFDELSGLKDENNVEVNELKKKLNAITSKIQSIKFKLQELKTLSIKNDSKIFVAQNNMSDSDSDEVYTSKSQALIKLCNTGIELKAKLNTLEPNEENTLSILSLTGLKNELLSAAGTRAQAKEALIIFHQSEILTGFSTSLQVQTRVLNGPFDNSSQFVTVVANLVSLQASVNDFVPADPTQTENKLTLQSKVNEAIITCNAEKDAFVDVQTKLANLNSLLDNKPEKMGYNKVRDFQETLTSAYDTFITANNVTANKYTKQKDVDKVNSEYVSLMPSVIYREQTLDDAYTKLNNSSGQVNTMVETLNNENIKHHNISLGDDAYLLRVGTELDSLKELLIDLQSSKSNLVSMLDPSTDEIENKRILGTDESVVTILTDLRGFFKTLNTNFESLNENKRTDDARNQRIETITSKFNELYNISFPMDPSKIILKGSQQTLENLSNEITLLRNENADASLIENLKKKYDNYDSVLKVHRNNIDAAKSQLNSSKAKVTEKLAEIDNDIKSENEDAYLESIDANLQKLDSLIETTAGDITQLNLVMNEYDKTDSLAENIDTYLRTKLEKRQQIIEKVSKNRETKEIQRLELERKTKVETWLRDSTNAIRILKGDTPIPENLFACNRLNSDIKAEYLKFDALSPTDEEKTIRNAQKEKELKPLNDKITELNAEKVALDVQQQLLSDELEVSLNLNPEGPFSSESSLNIDLIERRLKMYYENSNKLEKISGEVTADDNKKDFEDLLKYFKSKQVGTMRLEVQTNGETAETYIKELISSPITKLDEFKSYQQKLTSSQELLKSLRTSLDSFYLTSERYFPDDDPNSRDNLKANTEEFIKENTQKLDNHNKQMIAKINTLTNEKQLRDKTMNMAASNTDTVILNVTNHFNEVSVLTETPDLNVDDFKVQTEKTNNLYDLAIEAIRTEESIIKGNTNEDLGDRTQRLLLLSTKRDSLMTSKTAFDDYTSTNPNVLKNVEKFEINITSSKIVSELNKLNPENINIQNDKDLVNKINHDILIFNSRVENFGRMLKYGENNPFINLGYRGQLETFDRKLRERKATLNANHANTTAALETYDRVKSLKTQEQLKKVEASKNISIPMSETIEDARQLIVTLEAELDKVQKALRHEINSLNASDSISEITKNQGLITVEEKWIHDLKVGTQELVIKEEIREITNTIAAIGIQVNKNEINNVLSLTSTLNHVGEEYDKLIAKSRTNKEATEFLASKVADQQNINKKITALKQSIVTLTGEAEIHKQKLDGFDIFVANPENKNADVDFLLNESNKLLADANEYIRIHKEIDTKLGSVLVADNTLVLTKIETYIAGFREVKAAKELADQHAASEKLRIKTASITILEKANNTTSEAKRNASDFITNLGTSVSVGEDTLTEAMRLIVVATQAAALEIGLLDTTGINVYSLEKLIEQKNELERSKSVFETEQTFRVDKIKSDVELLKRTQTLEQELQFKSAQNSSEQIKTSITQNSKLVSYWYSRIMPEELGGYIFELNGNFRKQITDIRTKLNNEYKQSYEVEYRMLNENSALGDFVKYTEGVDTFIKNTELELAKIETDMASKEKAFTEEKNKKSEAEKLSINAKVCELMKKNLKDVLDGMETKINAFTGISIEADIRLASDFIQGIRSFSYQTATERETSYVFVNVMEQKLFDLIVLIAAKRSAEHSELLNIMFGQEVDISLRNAELLKQTVQNAKKHSEMEASILDKLATGATEDADRLSKLLKDSLDAAAKKAKEDAEELTSLYEEAKKNSERDSAILAELEALAKLNAELESAKLGDISKRNGFSEDSLMNYIIGFCLFVINYLEPYGNAKTVSANVLDILAYFMEFSRNSLVDGVSPTAIFNNVLHLVKQLESINGGASNSLAIVLVTYLDYRIARLILTFVSFINRIVMFTPVRTALPSVPTTNIGSSVKSELPKKLVREEPSSTGESNEKDNKEVPKFVSKDDEKFDEKDDETLQPTGELDEKYGELDEKDDETLQPAGELDEKYGELDEKDDENQLDESVVDNQEEAKLTTGISKSNGKSTSVSQKVETNVEPDDVCKNYDHLFEENYNLFVPPLTEMRGGTGGIVSTILSNTTTPSYTLGLNRGDTLTNIPNRDFQREPTPREILGLGPLDFQQESSTVRRAHDTYSRYLEWEDADGNTVIELDDITPHQNAVETKLGEQRQSEEDTLNKENADKTSVRNGQTLQQKLANVARVRKAKNLNAYNDALAKAKLAGPSEEEQKIITDYEAKLDAETDEEREAREKRLVDAVNDKAAKNEYDLAIRKVQQRYLKNQGPTDKQQQIISEYENIMEDEEERLALEARAVEKAEKDLYDATKSKKYFDSLTEAEKKIISDYEAREKETLEQRETREAKEEEEDIKTVEFEAREIFHNNMLENVRYWSRIFGLGGKIFNDVGYAFQIGSHFLNRQPQIGEAESVNEKESENEVENPKYFKEVTSKFLPSMTTIKTENNLSDADELNLYVKDVISDGRCFSGAALYSLKLNEIRKSHPISHGIGISWDVDFSPAEKIKDSQELNRLISETIIEQIKSKFDNKTETDLVEFVYEYYFGYENDYILDNVFESHDRNIIKSALSQLDLNKKITDLKDKLNKLSNSFKKYDESFSLTKLFKKAPQMEDFLALRGSGNYLPEEIQFNRYTNKDLWKLLHIEGEDTSKITFKLLNAELLKISNTIKDKPEFETYYTQYIGYIESLNQVIEPNAGAPRAKLDSYPWTEPTVGPAQVFADVNNTNVVIKYEQSYNEGNVVYNPRDPTTNEFKEAGSTIYLLFKNMNGWSHYVSLIDPQFNQEIKADLPPLPSDYTILELFVEGGEHGHLYENTYTYYYSDALNLRTHVRRLLRSIKTQPIIDEYRFFILYAMPDEAIEEDKKHEKIPVGFRTIEGPRYAVIDGKDSIYDYDISNYVTTASIIKKLPQLPKKVSKIALNVEEELTPDEYTILEINIGGKIVKNGHTGTIDETNGMFVETDQWGEIPYVFEPGERITKDFVEVNPDGTIMKENGIVIKNGTMVKVDKNGVFGEIPHPVTRWSTYLFTPAVHRFIEVYPDNTYLKEGDIAENGELQQNTYDYNSDGPNNYEKHLKFSARFIQPLIDDLLYFKLYNMSDDEIEENKRNEKIAPGFKTIEGPRKAIINGYDSIYDYNTSRYITTRPRVDDEQFFKLFNTSNKEIRKQKEKIVDRLPPSPKKVQRKAVINGKDAIFDYETFKYITTGPNEPHIDLTGTYYDDLFKKYEKFVNFQNYEKYEKYKPFLLDKRESIFANRKDKNLMYVTKTPKPMSGGNNKSLNHEYEALFQQEFEMEPEPAREDYNELFEMEPEPVKKDYADLFEMEPEPVVVVAFVEDYNDLFEMEPEPVRKDYTDLFEMDFQQHN